MCVVPFLVGTHSFPFPTFYREWAALALGLVAIAATRRLGGAGALGVPAIACGLLAFALVLGLQVLLGLVEFAERSATGMLYAAWAALLTTTAVHLRERFGLAGVVVWLQAALATAAFFLAVTGFMQRFQLQALSVQLLADPGLPMMGLIGQRNHFANVVSCGLISVAGLFYAGWLRLPTAVLIALPMMAALPISGSRSVWAYVVIAMACAPGWSRIGRRALLALGAAIVLLFLAQFAFDGAAGARLAESVASGQLDPKRWALSRYAWAIFTAHPIVGAGFGEFAWQVFQAAPVIGAGLDGVAEFHAHSLALQLLAETGIVGAACVLLPLGAWFVGFRRSKEAARIAGIVGTRAFEGARAWLLAVALIQLFHGMVEFPQWHADLLGLFALVLGLGARATRLPITGVWRWAPASALLAGAVVLTGALLDYRAIERWQRGLERDRAAGRPVTAERIGELVALRDSPFVWRVEGAIAGLVVAGDDPAPALALTGRALRGHPFLPLAARYADLLDHAGRIDEAAHVRRAAGVIAGRSAPGGPGR